MERHININIKCPQHPTENIEHVHIAAEAEKDLFCKSCLTSIFPPIDSNPNVKKIDEFISILDKYYKENDKPSGITSSPPARIADTLSSKEEALKTMLDLIEREKDKINSDFNKIQEIVNKVIENERTQRIQKLDNIFNALKASFTLLESKSEQYYSNKKHQPNIDEIVNSIETTQELLSLSSLIKGLKIDLNIGLTKTNRKTRENHLENLCLKIEKQRSQVLIYNQFNFEKLKSEIETNLTKLISEHIKLKESTIFINTSKILNNEDFDWIKSTLENPYSGSKFELLYQGSRDGMHMSKYHEKVDNKGPTITIIKTDQSKVFGFFLDKSWTSGKSNKVINSDRTLIFSVTNRKQYKYDNEGDDDSSEEEGYHPEGNESAFSFFNDSIQIGDSDIILNHDFKQGQAHPSSFDFAVEELSGIEEFQIQEIESYLLRV